MEGVVLVILLLTTWMMVDLPQHCSRKACGHEDYQVTPDGRKLPRLTSRQIRSALTGFNVTYQTMGWGPLNMYPPPRENYYKHGIVTVDLDRSSFVGKWKVKDDLLCILGTPVDGCRKVYAWGNALAVRLSDDGYKEVYLGTLGRR
jgi:hypothetical protein